MLKKIAGFLLLALLLVVGLLYSQQRHEPLKVSGFIEADELRLGSRVGGRVRKVIVSEGDTVHAQDVLVELEPFDLHDRRLQAAAVRDQRQAEHRKVQEGFRDEEIAQAQARLDQANEQLTLLKNGPRQQELEAARAEVDAAQADLELAEEHFARVEKLKADGAATQEALDLATKERKSAIAQVKARSEQLKLLEAGTRAEELAVAAARVREAEQQLNLMKKGNREEDIAQAYAALQAADGALSAIDRQLEELQITAPATGTVEAIELQPGDLVGANAPVISVIDTEHMWVRCYVPENQLDLKIGQQLSLAVDSFPGQWFSGEVSYISRQAEFTPSNIQTPEERSKQVFRIKVKLIDGLDVLRPGMAADVYLEGRP